MMKWSRSALAVALIGAFLMMDVGAASAVITVPGAPTVGTATAGQAQATLTWTAPVDTGGSPITSYTAVSTPGGHTATTANGTTLSVTVGGLTNGTAYSFTVHATNSVGSGAESAASNSVTPAAATVPGAPTIGTATRGNGSATITWTAPTSDGGSAVTGYTAVSSPGAHTASVTGSTLSATVTGLTNGTAYTFTVHATNSVGNSAESAASNAVIPATVPGVPTMTVGAATSGNGSATLTWSAPASNGGSPVTSYTVVSIPGGHTVTTANGTTVSATVAGLTNGIAYTFTVHATNDVGDSLESAPSNPVIPALPTVPSAPLLATATGGQAQASVSWAAPASDGGSPITSYTVTASPGGQTATTANGTTLSATVTGLTNGTTYSFTVHATNPSAVAPSQSRPTPSFPRRRPPPAHRQ